MGTAPQGRPHFFMLYSTVSQDSRSESSMLTLSEAKKDGRLEEFIAEQESKGYGPIDAVEFEDTAATVIKTLPQDDQTSDSPRRDGSREK